METSEVCVDEDMPACVVPPPFVTALPVDAVEVVAQPETAPEAVLLSPEAQEVVRKAISRGRVYQVAADGTVVVFRKDGITPDARACLRKSNDPEAPWGRKPDGSPRNRPGRKAKEAL